MTETIPTDKPVEIPGTVKFGFGQISKPTPKNIKWVFRAVLYLASFVTVVVTSDKSIPADTALTIVKYLAYLVSGVHGFSKFFGVDITTDAEEAKTAFNK